MAGGRGGCVYRLLQLAIRHLAWVRLYPITAIPTRAGRLHNVSKSTEQAPSDVEEALTMQEWQFDVTTRPWTLRKEQTTHGANMQAGRYCASRQLLATYELLLRNTRAHMASGAESESASVVARMVFFEMLPIPAHEQSTTHESPSTSSTLTDFLDIPSR